MEFNTYYFITIFFFFLRDKLFSGALWLLLRYSFMYFIYFSLSLLFYFFYNNSISKTYLIFNRGNIVPESDGVA